MILVNAWKQHCNDSTTCWSTMGDRSMYHRSCWMRCAISGPQLQELYKLLCILLQSLSEWKEWSGKNLWFLTHLNPKNQKGTAQRASATKSRELHSCKHPSNVCTVCMHPWACMWNLLRHHTELWKAKSISVSLNQKGPASESFTPGSMVYALDYTMTLGFKTLRPI